MMHHYTHIETILDRSGSMRCCLDSTIAGFNGFIADQKKINGKCTVTQVQFDDRYEIHYHYANIEDVIPINRDTYIPRGSTALLDAIYKTVTRLGQELAARPEHLRPSKVIVLIQTDGQENASVECVRSQVFDKVKHQQEKYNWEFVFAGTNQDAIMTATSYGIPTRSTIYYSNTSYGVANVWASVSSNIASSRAYGTLVNFDDTARASTVDPNDTSNWAATVVSPVVTTTTTGSTIVVDNANVSTT